MKCKNCCIEFESNRYNKIFCSKKCQEEFYKKIEVFIPCILCGWNLITETHHIKHQIDGGTNEENNLVIVCPNHHRMLHNEKYREEIERKIFLISNNDKKEDNKGDIQRKDI